ncbi:ABC transporter ATP-binding protein [Leadbettera azotonutricia]|uniref:Nitrate transport ATP-binding protein NrtC n=1 Tax=Leadbettera azotonutricia (strain ATCC BAA-888 / DSM 13862 / ZAS-9) TaxID=545695 RepID=F5YEM7_LEAAZ|nr:ABC transporter ATP-binding protein [Leadbettera azotonutricia]AEF82073.1 nitrate transport ATP-binding protein NrtC [Leadbettera azotonutricia ZAS-9]
MMNKIEVDNLSVSYNEGNKRFTALTGISFTVQAGEFISIIGSSGCGKSTLLNVLGGLIAPSSGRVAIDGIPVAGPGKNRSMVFQHYSLFPWMTARNNVVFGIKHAATKLSGKEIVSRANSFLEKVGLENFKDKFPAQLSGGMKQRVAIARALAMDTEILLMDEPFGAVDAKNRTLLQELLLKLWEGNSDDTIFPIGENVSQPPRERKTVVFITHDIDEAILLSDRIIMFANSPGRIFKELEVHFPRPRSRSSLVQTEEYTKLRNELLTLFYKDFGSNI